MTQSSQKCVSTLSDWYESVEKDSKSICEHGGKEWHD